MLGEWPFDPSTSSPSGPVGSGHDPEDSSAQYPGPVLSSDYSWMYLVPVQALLAAPEPDDPQDAVVARQYQENFTIFKATAQYWAATFAGSPYKVCL